MSKEDLVAAVHKLGPGFAAAAAKHDADDSFVAANFEAMKAHHLFSAGVPGELGGGDASVRELCDMLRELARYCPSTALAFSMHTHQVAIPAWRWRNENGVGEPLLRRVAAEELVLISSGGSDWLDSSGRLEKVDGGYRMNARKLFASASPAGALLMTSAVYDDPADGATVFHFPLPFTTNGVQILDTWRTLGMRGTGSHDVLVTDAFVPEAAIGGRRPKGQWGIFHLVALIALPLVYSVYLGVAQAARDIAIRQAQGKREDATLRQTVGEMENALCNARLAVESAVALADARSPGPETTNEILMRRSIAGEASIRTVEKAMEVAGGAAFYRSLGLERLFRDVQAARYHPLTLKRQLEHTARYVLGLDV